MSRNGIDGIKEIFSFLESHIDSESQQHVVHKERRISPNPEYSEQNIDAFIKSKVLKPSYFLANIPVIGVKYLNQSYVVIPSSSNLPDNFSNGIECNVLNNDDSIAEGLSLAVISHKFISLKNNIDLSNQLIEKIFGGISPGEECETFEFKEIISYYTEFQIWKVDSHVYNIEKELDLNRIYACYLIQERLGKIRNFILINFVDDTLIQIQKLLEDINSSFISDVIFKAITSTHWSHCYLEFYRCIENIYIIYYIDKLKNDLGIDTKKLEKGLEDIGFKGVESLNIKNLFSTITTNIASVKELKTALGCQDAEVDEDKIKERTAEKVYEIRCKIAHLKYKHSNNNFDDTNWNIIIKNICDIIGELYNKYSACLNDLSA